MGGFIPLLIIFAIIESIVSKNKKKAEQAKKAGGAQRAAQPKPKSKPKPQPKPQQVRVPYTKEEWSAFLNELNRDIASDEPRRKAAPAPQPRVELHSEFEEGSSFEGESHEEHAKHLRRIEEEEALHRQELEALNDLREANLDKLRAAVVMSEVLGKPVSLRPRVGYHR